MPPSHVTHERTPYRLITLGGAALLTSDDRTAVEQRRRLALLVLVASGGVRGVSRDKLTATLNPDSPTDSARHALHQLLYYLRRQLGDGVFVGTDPLRVDPQVVAFDVSDFEDAIARGALAEAASLYGGPFLDGFHLGESSAFEEWVAGERARLAARHAEILVRLAEEAVARGDHDGSLQWWRRLTEVDPLNGRWSVRLMQALSESGNRGAALRHGEQYQSLLREELDSEPDPAVAALLIELRTSPAAGVEDLVNRRPIAWGTGAAPSAAPPWPSSRPPAEATPFVDRQIGARASSRRRSNWWRGVGAGALLAAVALLAARRNALPRDAPSLGVVPIANLAGDSLDFVAAGVASYTMDRLMGDHGIRVVSLRGVRTAAQGGASAVGRRVGVSAILSGTLARERDTVWLRVEVVRTSDGARLGSGRFVVESRRLPAVESELLDLVGLALRLTPLKRAEERPRDAEDVARLMRAEYHFGRRDTASFRRAFDLYMEAIDRDPASADAYARLAQVYGAFGFYGVMPIPEAFERSRAAARRALQLDPSSVYALASLAHLTGVRDWAWGEAERGLRDALRLEPWRAEHWMLLGTQLRVVGRFDESIAAYRRARDLDPLARHYRYQIAHAFQCAGEPDSALAALRDAISLGTSFPAAHSAAANILANTGRYDEAIAEWRIAATESGDTTRRRMLDGARGRHDVERFVRETAQLELDARRVLPTGASVLPTVYSSIYAMMGDTARALDWLERAVAERDPNAPMIGCHYEYDALRESPRFVALLRTMHLTPATYGKRPVSVASTGERVLPQ